MPYALFHDHCPAIAERETRTVIVLDNSDLDLPPAEYAFLEMFCNEPRCDCRRVFFYVVSSISKNLEAVVTYGWESPSFYRQWLGHDDPHDIIELKGPSLNLGSPQSYYAPAILELFRNVLLPDRPYIERVISHYHMFREQVEVKSKTKKKGRHNQAL
jgi:hypothetical protein